MYSIRIWDLIGKNAKPFEICPNFPPTPSPPKVVNRPGVAGAVLQIALVYKLSLHRKKDGSVICLFTKTSLMGTY